MAPERNFSYGKVAFIGLGFGAITLVTSVYNALIPLYLQRFTASTGLIGAVMAMDNVAAITLIPLFGAWSDRVWTRFGRRRPFILAAMPVAAAAFALLTQQVLFLTFILVDIVFTLAMAAVRAPTVALMPDVTPPEKRSTANGVINLVGGIGAAAAFLAGGALYEANPSTPFLLGSAVMLVVPVLLFAFVREPEDAGPRHETDADRALRSAGFIRTLLGLGRPAQRQTLRLLLALFCWFSGYAGVEAFFTVYATSVLGLAAGVATTTLVFVSGTFLVAALPAGVAGARAGRKPVVMGGLCLFAAVLAVLVPVRDLALLRLLFVVAGAAWALVVVNAYPMVVARAPQGQVGAYTGLYYFFSSLAAIAAPPFVGAMMDLMGRAALLPSCAVLFIASAVLLGRVRGADPAHRSEHGREAGMELRS